MIVQEMVNVLTTSVSVEENTLMTRGQTPFRKVHASDNLHCSASFRFAASWALKMIQYIGGGYTFTETTEADTNGHHEVCADDLTMETQMPMIPQGLYYSKRPLKQDEFP